jgi:hypothetical protein
MYTPALSSPLLFSVVVTATPAVPVMQISVIMVGRRLGTFAMHISTIGASEGQGADDINAGACMAICTSHGGQSEQ